MPKSPHTPEFRAMVSQEYLDGLDSYTFLANKYQIGIKTLKEWVAKYRRHGSIAFQSANGNSPNSSDFKTMCVEAVLSGTGSVDDIVAKYNISSRKVLRTWISLYNANRELKDYHLKREIYMAETCRKTTIKDVRKLKEQKMEQSMSRVGHCIDNGPTEGFWGIIKTAMYQMYDITDEASLRFAIMDYLRFYSEERPQNRYQCRSPLEVRTEALTCGHPIKYPIPENKRIKKYKEKWCA